MSNFIDDKPLNSKEERFCYEYLANKFNATKACVLAGYSEKTAYSKGSQLLRKVKVQNKIKHMKENLAETAGISALMIANEHAKIAFSNMDGLLNTWIERKDFEQLSEDQKSCIKEVNTKVLKKNIGTQSEPEIVDVEFVQIKTYDKQKSLDSLTDLLGYKAPNKTELTGKDGKDFIPEHKLTPEERKAEIAALKSELNVD